MNEPDSAAIDAARLHQRLLDGDPAAPAEIADAFLLVLVQRLLRGAGRGVDPHQVESAAIDALFNYIQRPEQYHPERAPLLSYLSMAAKGDLANALKSERRHTLRAVSLDDEPAGAVELFLAERNESVEEIVMERMGTELPDGLSRERALLLIAQEFPAAVDRRLLQLRLDGERKTEAYAVVLGLAPESEAEQRAQVKRAKDRIDKRLRRLRERLMDAPAGLHGPGEGT